MTRADKLRALAARVEAAQGADRALDGESWSAVNGYAWVMWDGAGAVFRQSDGSIGHQRADRIPAFTASLDAAVTLVRDHWSWELHASGLCRVTPRPHHPQWKGGGVRTQQTHAATPALALTAAALRALAEEAGE
jgi:hypothetical protein